MSTRGHLTTARILVVALLLVIGACANGSDEQIAAPTTSAPAPTSTSGVVDGDCETYDPAGLEIEEEEDVWFLSFEGDRLTGHLRQEDAEAMRSVAEHYSQQCFVGRGNDRDILTNYVVEYWSGSSDVAEGGVPEIGCIRYDVEALEIEDVGEQGFVLTDGETRLHLIDTPADGRKALALARQHTRMCLVGADTGVIHEYWL